MAKPKVPAFLTKAPAAKGAKAAKPNPFGKEAAPMPFGKKPAGKGKSCK